MYLVYDNVFAGIRNIYFRKILGEYGGVDKKILDYGCGPGDLLLLAKEMKIRAYGIDKFVRSVELAKQRKLDVHLGDYRDMHKWYKLASFDVIFLQSVLEHMQDPITELLTLTKYLKKGGRLILSSPTPSTYFWDDPTHVRPFTPKSFLTMSEVLGLRTELVTYVASYLLNWQITSRLVYLALNILPFSLGSNLLGVYKKST